MSEQITIDLASRARALRKRMRVKPGPPPLVIREAVKRAVELAVAAEKARRLFMTGHGSAESTWRLDQAARRAEQDALALTKSVPVEQHYPELAP